MTREEYEAKYGAKPFSGVSQQIAAATESEPGFFENVQGAFQKRSQNVQATRQQHAQGTLPGGNAAGVLRTSGQVAGLIGDVAFEGLKAVTPDFIEKPVGKALGSAAQTVAQTLPVQRAMQGYQLFKTQHPDAAASLEAITNIASILPIGKGLQVGGAAANTGVKATLKAIPDLGPSENSLITQRVTELDKLAANNAPIRKVLEKHTSRGVDSKRLLAETDLLHGAVDDTGTIRTANARQELTDFIAPHEGTISKVLEREGVKIPLGLVERRLRTAIDNSNLEGASLEAAHSKLAATLKGLARRADEDGLIPLQKVQDAKINAYATIDYMNSGAKMADKTIARTFKELVEQNTKSADAAALNKELMSHYSVLNLLEKLDGKKVEGGKLGKYFAQTLGAVVGSHFGPLGAIAGAEIAGRAKGAALSQTFKGQTGATLKTSDAMKAAQQGKAPLQLPAYKSNSVGARNQSQSPTTTTKKKVNNTPLIVPRPATNATRANVDAKPANPTKGAWPTTASKPSKAGSTSTGSAPTGKEGVSAQSRGTSGPFEGAIPKEIIPALEGKVPVYRTGDVTKLSNDDQFGKVRYFADRKEMASMYGSTVNQAHVTIKKPFVISERTPDDIGQVALVRQYGGPKEFRKYLEENGYDGIVIQKNYGNEIIALDSKQIAASSPSIPKELEPKKRNK